MQPTDTAAAAGELVGQIQDSARKLGLTWQMVKATVYEVTSSSEMTVIVDGDTIPVGVISMVGPVPVAGRVWVMIVPPGGLYVVGTTDGRFGAGPIGKPGLLTSGNVAASAAAEVAIPAASWATEPELTIANNRIAKLTYSVFFVVSAATDSRTVLRYRKGSETTSGTLLAVYHVSIPSSATTASVQTFIRYVKNTSGAPVTTKLTVTNQRDAGAATISLAGNAFGNPMELMIEDLCHVDDAPELAASIFSV